MSATCHCGTILYRSLDSELHCFRCESRNDLCPACDGRTFRMKGKVMRTCEICSGTGYRHKTVAPTYGQPSETLMGDSSSDVFDAAGVYGYPDVGRSEIGRRHGSDMNRPGE